MITNKRASQVRDAMWNGLWVVVVWVSSKWPMHYLWGMASDGRRYLMPQSYYEIELGIWIAAAPVWVLCLSGWPGPGLWRIVIGRLVVLLSAEWIVAMLIQVAGMWWGCSIGFALVLICILIHLAARR